MRHETARFEFVVEFGRDDYDDLDWWSAVPRGLLEYDVDYEYMRLHIYISSAALACAPEYR